MHEREFRMPRREVECVRQKRAVMQARPLRLTCFVRCLVAYKPLQRNAANENNVIACADAVNALVRCSNSLLEKSLRGYKTNQ